MFRNDDNGEIERAVEEKQKALDTTKNTAEENRKRAAALRESVGKTATETKEKLDSLLRQSEPTPTEPSQSGLFSSTANKTNEPIEEPNNKPRKGKGGCNIL